MFTLLPAGVCIRSVAVEISLALDVTIDIFPEEPACEKFGLYMLITYCLHGNEAKHWPPVINQLLHRL